MADDQTFCGGLLKDGTKCEACVFEPRDGQTRLSGWKMTWPPLSRPKWVQLYCLKCGTLLGVTEGGEPTREPMVPVAERNRWRWAVRAVAMTQAKKSYETWGISTAQGKQMIDGIIESALAAGDELREDAVALKKEPDTDA